MRMKIKQGVQVKVEKKKKTNSITRTKEENETNFLMTDRVSSQLKRLEPIGHICEVTDTFAIKGQLKTTFFIISYH